MLIVCLVAPFLFLVLSAFMLVLLLDALMTQVSNIKYTPSTPQYSEYIHSPSTPVVYVKTLYRYRYILVYWMYQPSLATT